MQDRKAKTHSVLCSICGETRYVTYAQRWNISRGYSTGDCRKCKTKVNGQMTRFSKGQVAWNSGLKGFGQGHPPYYVAQGRENHFFGKTHSKESKEKMRLAKLGKCGSLANNWQEGRTKLQKRRMLKDYQDWRRKVLVRDEFTCNECGAKNVVLHVHHIERFSECNGTGREINLDNGMTLCQSCHRSVHFAV